MTNERKNDLISVCLDFSWNYHVSAGAGTGKTTILTRRALAFLLASDKNSPEGLLCMTFTRNAAAEMRMRIRSELEAVSKILSGEMDTAEAVKRYNFLPEMIQEMTNRGFGNAKELNERAKKALEDLDLAVISTLHSFCGDVIREFPLQTDTPPDFLIDEEGLHENEIIDDELHSFIFSLLNSEKMNKADTLFLVENLKIEDLKEIFKCAAMQRDTGEILKKTANEMKSVIFRRKSGKFVVESDDAAEIARKVALLAAEFSSHANSKFHEGGMISYDDMLQKCRKLLRDNRQVRDLYKSRFGAILVDELQDTDPVQFDIIYALGEKLGTFSTALKKVKFTPGKVFLVGDPKQSIYRFRGADIELYKEMLEVIKNSGLFKEVELSVNYRSHKGILSVVNRVFSAAMGADYSPIRPELSKDACEKGKEVEFFFPTLGSNGTVLNADEAREVMAVRIGRWIEKNIDMLEITERDGTRRKLRYGDIAILTRSSVENRMRHLVSTFKMRGIPYIFEGSKGFYLSREIRDMVSFMKTVVSPGDRNSLIGFLRSPLCALPDWAILGLAQRGLLDYSIASIPAEMKAENQIFENVEQIFAKLKEAHALSSKLPTSELVEWLFAEFHVMPIYCDPAWRHGESVNIEKFKKKVIDIAGTGTTFRSAINAVAAMMKEEEKEAENPLVDETVEAVRIRTIHSAKGLEFPVVIIYDFGAGKKPVKPAVITDRKNGNCFIKLKNKDESYFSSEGYLDFYNNDYKKIEDDEETRVNYVAMTRAMEKLLVFANIWKKHWWGHSLNREVASTLSALGMGKNDIRSVELKIENISCKVNLFEHERLKDLSYAPREGEGSPAPLKIPEVAEVIAKRESEYGEYEKKLIRSPSADVSERFDSERDEEESAMLMKTANAHRVTVGKMTGLAAHRILQKLDFNDPSLSLTEILPKVLDEFFDRNQESLRKALQSHINNIFFNFFKSPDFQEIRESEIIGREIPMIAPNADGTAITGRIDIIYRRRDGAIVVADYKTGKDKDSAEKYEAQRETYTECVKKALNENNVFFKIIYL